MPSLENRGVQTLSNYLGKYQAVETVVVEPYPTHWVATVIHGSVQFVNVPN